MNTEINFLSQNLLDICVTRDEIELKDDIRNVLFKRVYARDCTNKADHALFDAAYALAYRVNQNRLLETVLLVREVEDIESLEGGFAVKGGLNVAKWEAERLEVRRPQTKVTVRTPEGELVATYSEGEWV